MSHPAVSRKPQIIEGGAFPAGTRPALDWLLDPILKSEFFQHYFEKKTLVIRRNQRNYFDALFSLDEVDRVLTTLDRRYPDIVLKNAKKDLAAEDYTVDGEILDITKVYQLFHEGSTITLAFLDTVVPSLTAFCRSLEEEFSCPFQTNIYMTPPNAQGAKPHYDTHDVFVLQVAGSKKWTIFGTPVELPLPGQEFDSKVHEIGEPTLEFELQPGDTAYVPRGVAHEARSTDTVSLHITTGMLRYTWADLLLELVANASLQDAAFRKALPPGFARQDFDRGQARETMRALMQKIPQAANLEETLGSFVDEFMSSCPPLLRGQFAQLANLDRLTPDSIVGAREGAVARLQENGDAIKIDSYRQHIMIPAFASEAVRFALSHPRYAVRDLPGNLDDAGKLTLVRRLIREGLLLAH
jgi:ribosomal protein L16 Arg81 hydroxylase